MDQQSTRESRAQEMLMDGIANILGHWTETYPLDAEVMTGNEQDEFRQIMEQQADRVAELFGHKEAWSN